MNTILRTCQVIVLVAAMAAHGRAQAQVEPAEPAATPTPPPKFEPPTRLPVDLVHFFSGEWQGQGEFANGRKIEADVSFAPDLDNQWLVYRHHDLAPNQYQALGLWGFEAVSKTFVMVVNDNFGGSRLFSSEGWTNGKIVFRKAALITPQSDARLNPPTTQERFTFERQTDDSFKMTYESSRDGASWQLGDYLVFKKQAKK